MIMKMIYISNNVCSVDVKNVIEQKKLMVVHTSLQREGDRLLIFYLLDFSFKRAK